MPAQIHEGHRTRMKAKFLRHGPAIFDTYELLEMLLYYTIPYRDTNPVAKALLSAFGSLDGVFSARREDLLKVDGIGEKTADFLLRFGAFGMDAFLEESRSGVYFDDFFLGGQYLAGRYGNPEEPVIGILLLDNRLRLIGEEILYRDTDFSSAKVKPKPFLDAALLHGASAAVLFHTHRGGMLCPSEGDRATTRLIEEGLLSLGITLVEHYLICGTHFVGFHARVKLGAMQSQELSKFLQSKENGIHD